MILTAKKSTVNGTVSIPASKSHTIRAVAIASMADGTSTIRNPLISSDAISAMKCYFALGASIDSNNSDKWLVKGNGGNVAIPERIIDVGNSGTTLRLALGSAALCNQGEEISFTGDAQIQSRPIEPLLKSLTDLGAKAISLGANGRAPAKVTGKLRGGKTTIECVTSQYLSSLLLACPLAENDSEIEVTLLNEPDYVRLTMDWLDKQGIIYEHDNMRVFRIKGSQKYKAFDAPVPADFSSATFFMCAAAAIGGEVVLEGLDYSDSQPDKAVASYLHDMGADVEISGNQTIVRAKQLRGIEIDMNRTPDALPAMAVMGAFAKGETRLLNVAQARKKETDRISCMAKELSKMGVDIQEREDGLIIKESRLKAADICGHSDHRIVMAMAIAAMGADGETKIDSAEAMNITFPNYVELMQSIGGLLELND